MQIEKKRRLYTPSRCRMSKPIQRFSTSLIPVDQQMLGSRIHPWHEVHAHHADVGGDADIRGVLFLDRGALTLADARTMTDPEPLTDALSKVQALQGVRFTRRETPRIGLVAEEVAPHVPEAVVTSTHPGAYEYVSHDTLVPLLIESIKTLADRVEALENGSDSEDAN